MNVPEFCYAASIEDVEGKGFSLVPSKYIEFVNRDEQVDYATKIAELQKELSIILAEEEQNKVQLKRLFAELGAEL